LIVEDQFKVLSSVLAMYGANILAQHHAPALHFADCALCSVKFNSNRCSQVLIWVLHIFGIRPAQ
jgi:hypothetical protein